jgi:hypothetical protein
LICAFFGLETEIFCLNVVFGFFFEKDKRIHSQAKAKDTFFPNYHKSFAYNRSFGNLFHAIFGFPILPIPNLLFVLFF